MNTEPVPEYILVRADEDGNPIRWLGEDDLAHLLANPREWGVDRFLEGLPTDDHAYLSTKCDPAYWADRVGLLLKVETVVPVPARGYRLPDASNE